MSPLSRILVASEPGRDGVFDFVRCLVAHLHRHHRAIAVDLVYSSRRAGDGLQPLVQTVKERGGAVLDLAVVNAPGLSDLAATRKLHDFIRRHPPDIVHAHSSKMGALVRLLALLPGSPPVLYTPHAYYGLAQAGGAKEWGFNMIERGLGHIGHSHHVSEDERQFALDCLHLSPKRLHAISNGIDTGFFSPASAGEKSQAREVLGIPGDAVVITTVGRHSNQKNYAPLYRILTAVLEQTPEMVFVHAGAGASGLRAALPERVRARCHAFEFYSDVRQLLHASDGFVLTSLYEGLSLAMLQALSCGLPALLTDVAGFQLLKAHGFSQVTWLPDPRDHGDFDETLSLRLFEFAKAAVPDLEQVSLVREHFTQSRQLEKVVDLYQYLTAG